MKKYILNGMLVGSLLAGGVCYAQIAERPRPEEWKQLVPGGKFMDRFLPMKGKELSSDTWGAENVLPRFVDNGIEDRTWSYWGGNILRDADGLFHLFVCGWLESSAKGHGEWPRSTVFDAVSDNPVGPFVVRREIGRGHNPEIFRAKDGKHVIYVIDGRYVSDRLDGPWEYGQFEFNARDRRIIEGLSNLSFAQREDGSYVMVCRGGGIWISETGLTPYNQLTDGRVYPPVEGRFEDPVIWRDHVQYHMIVNDWLGRIAWYLRSKDGVDWVVDPGEAYAPGIAVHEDGTVEDWFKFERIKILQDEHGRAVQANFAVIDVLKKEDRASDSHSSKNIGIPLNPGMLLTLLDKEPITPETQAIRVRIQAEEGFDPVTDIDVESLRFGASAEVNFGRGCKALKAEADGHDLVVTFKADGHGITDAEFAPKMIGRTISGRMVYGYARLPCIDYIEPILSARKPLFEKKGSRWEGAVEVQNFGQTASDAASLSITYSKDGTSVEVADVKVPALKPYEKKTLPFTCRKSPEEGWGESFVIAVCSDDKTRSGFTVRIDGPVEQE